MKESLHLVICLQFGFSLGPGEPRLRDCDVRLVETIYDIFLSNDELKKYTKRIVGAFSSLAKVAPQSP